MDVPFDPAEVFAEATVEVAQSIASEQVRSELLKSGFSEIMSAGFGEGAKSVAGLILGPTLHVFLKLLDPTQKKLDVLIAQPFHTGMQLAQLALSMSAETDGDQRIRNAQLTQSLESLEQAFSHAKLQQKLEDCLRIRIAQASVARAMNALEQSSLIWPVI
jgi:hypothetical protein